MIPGFETETNPLNGDELKMATEIAYILMNHVGKENMITSTRMVNHLNGFSKLKVDGPRIRKIINHIRTLGMVKNLIACSGGYYIEPDIGKVQKYIDGLRHRAESILAVSKAMQKQLAPYQSNL